MPATFELTTFLQITLSSFAVGYLGCLMAQQVFGWRVPKER